MKVIINIMIKFDKLWQTMADKGISQYKLYTVYGISRAQVHRLKNNESVTTNTLNILCNILDCRLEDIAEFEKDIEQ